MRVALLTNILAPYRMPGFRALAATPGVTLRVLVNAEREFDRHWELDPAGLDVESVPGASFVRGGRTLHVPSPPALFRALRRFQPDAVVSSELGARSLLAWLYCRAVGARFAIWAEPTPARVAAAGWLRRRLGRFLLARADSVIVPGREAHRAFRSWGVSEAKLYTAPNSHDTETYAKLLAQLDSEPNPSSLHAGLACRSRIALVVGRLLPEKGVRELLAAWDRVPPALRRGWTLLFVGNGREQSRVRVAFETHAQGEILRLPEIGTPQLVELYAAADLLVFPSLADAWGIAVNEAMACGLPVVCSSRAGCVSDLVLPGETGFRADPLDEAAFRDALVEALTSDSLRELGARARAHLQGFDGAALARGFLAAVRG